MYDIVSVYLSDETMRCMAVWTLSISAAIIFVLAFAVTEGAGFRCPLAFLRGVQRLLLCALAICKAYAAAWIAQTGWTPPGPVLILFIMFMLVIMVSAARHLMAPAVNRNNTWGYAWHVMRENGKKWLMEDDRPHKVPGVR